MPNTPPTRPTWASTTKSELLAAFERELRARYAWAADPQKLARVTTGARRMLNAEPGVPIDRGGPAFCAALRSVGLPERLALHRLQELDDGSGWRRGGPPKATVDADEEPTCRGMLLWLTGG